MGRECPPLALGGFVAAENQRNIVARYRNTFNYRVDSVMEPATLTENLRQLFCEHPFISKFAFPNNKHLPAQCS